MSLTFSSSKKYKYLLAFVALYIVAFLMLLIPSVFNTLARIRCAYNKSIKKFERRYADSKETSDIDNIRAMALERRKICIKYQDLTPFIYRCFLYTRNIILYDDKYGFVFPENIEEADLMLGGKDQGKNVSISKKLNNRNFFKSNPSLNYFFE